MNPLLLPRPFVFARLCAVCVWSVFLLLAAQPVWAQPGTPKSGMNIYGPIGSVAFGQNVTILPNGNFVVIDAQASSSGIYHTGAVYLYNGASKTQISVMRGSQAGDEIGSNGITILPDGDFLVSSPKWNLGGVIDAGAVTLCSRTSGCPNTPSAANSLVGSQTNDGVGSYYISIINNNFYYIASPTWDNGSAANAGAITFCRTEIACTGAISAGNSLVGSSLNDQIGQSSIYTIPNGGLVIANSQWDNSGVVNAGAVRFCSAADSCYGANTPTNSLVGSTSEDRVGGSIAVLSNGDYLVRSSDWSDGLLDNVGAITWCSQAGGCTGNVSFSNSLIGQHANDQIGSGWIVQLDNGKYVVLSPNWDRGSISDAGAATWCSSNGCSGYITNTNSLVGSTNGDQVGLKGIHLINSDKYLILSPKWDYGGTADIGAATWCSNSGGCVDEISPVNSLTGSQAGDGLEMDASSSLDAHTYIVMFPNWDNSSTPNAGAVKWCHNNTGCFGAITTEDSLVGSHANDQVGLFGTEIGGGRYILANYNWNGTAAGAGAVTICSNPSGCSGVVSSSNSLVGSNAGDHIGAGSFNWNANALIFRNDQWHYGTAANAGALTFCRFDNLSACTGAVSTSNSLIGTHENDMVAYENFMFLANGNYIAISTHWAGVGAVTFCNGSSGCTAAVSAGNSLVGNSDEDGVGFRVRELANGNYVITSPYWNFGALNDAGAITFCSGTAGCQGNITTNNSLIGSSSGDELGPWWIETLDNGDYLVQNPFLDHGGLQNSGNVVWCDGNSGCLGRVANFPRGVNGSTAQGGNTMTYAYDPVNQQVVVGRPADNIVTILSAQVEYSTYLPWLSR